MKDLSSDASILHARIDDLICQAENRGHAAGDFLTPAQQLICDSYLHKTLDENSYSLFGGAPGAERKVPVILDCSKNFSFDESAEIKALRITASSGEAPGHRDCLGALTALGIEREVIGDIVIFDYYAVIFVKNKIAPFIISSLEKIGHDRVKADYFDLPSDFKIEHKFEELCFTVSSMRADCIVSAVTGMSREAAKEYILRKNLDRNYTIFENPSGLLSEGDMLSLRHKGRFEISEAGELTRKGRIRISILRFI